MRPWGHTEKTKPFAFLSGQLCRINRINLNTRQNQKIYLKKTGQPVPWSQWCSLCGKSTPAKICQGVHDISMVCWCQKFHCGITITSRILLPPAFFLDFCMPWRTHWRHERWTQGSMRRKNYTCVQYMFACWPQGPLKLSDHIVAKSFFTM
jgi:hypothetical protein